MIALIVVLVVAIAGAIWLRAAWVRIDREIAQRQLDREATDATMRAIRELLHETESRLVTLLRDDRIDSREALAVINRQLADQNDIIRGIVTFLDDVPQNFAFHKAGLHHKMVLPDRLKLSLTRSDQ